MIGAHSAGFFYYFGQAFRVLQYGTWPEHIFIERLPPVILHEDRALQRVQQGSIVNVAVGVVDNMNKADMIAYFDGCAPTWDQELLKNDAVIAEILDHAGISENMDVLDIACGTGVLFPYYTKRGVTSVTGVDISPEMVKIARGKYVDSPQITVICGDIEEIDLQRRFDAVVLYNAFPHFCDAERLIKGLAALTKPGGRLTIAHGMSRDKINAHHQGSARAVSNGLMPADQLAELLLPYFDVDVVISNDSMYQVSGNRNQIMHESIGRE